MNRTMSVSQLSSYIRGVFDDEELLHDVTLTGEVADISYSDRHTFLVLSEGNNSVRCVHFSSRDNIEKGARVALRGSISYYDKRNSVSFNYSEYFLQGVGDKNAKLTELKQKLSALGYFENRPQLPKYIVNVVVVTSPDGAAIRDFMRVVYDKCPFVNIRVYPVKVQGEGAARQIADAVEKLQNVKTDAIVVCRGGGSDEDLDCFNDEALAVAVAKSVIPVISAVGHEINYSLCDCCAGTRAGTPSIAGEIVNSHAERLLTDLGRACVSMRNAVEEKYIGKVHRLNRLGTATTHAVSARVQSAFNRVKLEMQRAHFAVGKRADGISSKLSNVAQRMRSGVVRRIDGARAHCEKLTALLGVLDPHRIIKIGYAVALKDKLRISSAEQLKKNDGIRLLFADGAVNATVTSVETDGETR